MGDKNPKAQQKSKKQDEAKQGQAKAAHDAKQAPPAPASKGKK